MNSSKNARGQLEGGIPDWASIEAYGDYEGWTFERWRWEFKRRHRDLRFWFYLTLQEHDRRTRGQPHARINLLSLPEYRDIFFYLPPIQAAKWGYAVISNPFYSDRPDIEEDNSFRFQRRTIVGAHMYQIAKGDANLLDVLGLGVAITFDPNAPIAPQVRGLEEYLLSLRHRDIGPDIERHHPEKWLSYLRVLDARSSGATWAECSTVLLPMTARTPQSARDTHRAALRLQDRL